MTLNLIVMCEDSPKVYVDELFTKTFDFLYMLYSLDTFKKKEIFNVVSQATGIYELLKLTYQQSANDLITFTEKEKQRASGIYNFIVGFFLRRKRHFYHLIKPLFHF